jgi:hypothetical protein
MEKDLVNQTSGKNIPVGDPSNLYGHPPLNSSSSQSEDDEFSYEDWKGHSDSTSLSDSDEAGLSSSQKIDSPKQSTQLQDTSPSEIAGGTRPTNQTSHSEQGQRPENKITARRIFEGLDSITNGQEGVLAADSLASYLELDREHLRNFLLNLFRKLKKPYLTFVRDNSRKPTRDEIVNQLPYGQRLLEVRDLLRSLETSAQASRSRAASRPNHHSETPITTDLVNLAGMAPSIPTTTSVEPDVEKTQGSDHSLSTKLEQTQPLNQTSLNVPKRRIVAPTTPLVSRSVQEASDFKLKDTSEEPPFSAEGKYDLDSGYNKIISNAEEENADAEENERSDEETEEKVTKIAELWGKQAPEEGPSADEKEGPYDHILAGLFEEEAEEREEDDDTEVIGSTDNIVELGDEVILQDLDEAIAGNNHQKRRTRREQTVLHAVKVATQFNLSKQDALHLATAMNLYGYSAAKTRIVNLLELGATAKEIKTAAEVRCYWEQESQYHVNFRSNRSVYSKLTWNFSLSLVRFFRLEQWNSLEEPLNQLYQNWYPKPHKNDPYPSFLEFLMSIVNR